MLTHSFHEYKWPQSLLQDLECWVRNFIWSGDIDSRKCVTVAWHNRGNPGMAGFGGFFIDSDFLWGLLCAILGSNQLFLQNQWLPSWQSKKRLVKAGEIFGWKLILNFWLQAYSDPFLVHWSIYTRCLNCIKLTQSFSFRITHIYREGNACADKLAVLGSQGLGYTWWHSPPSFVSKEFFRYRQGLPFYRFL
ncbi:hypothetical protein glysoja_019374 [Glycine soja]|nr:hypothetical protein glysoja_019374 [Glycine soja]